MNKTRTIANATNNNNNVKKSSTAIVGSSNTGTASKSASALKQQLDEQQAQLASLRAHCRTLETQLDAKHSALLALEQQQQQQHQSQPQPHKASAADAHERDVVQLARQVVAERTTLAKMKAEKARITGEIANKSNELASQKKQIAKLKATNDALELKCTQAEGAMQSEEKELLTLNARYRAEIDELEFNVSQVEKRAIASVGREALLEREARQRNNNNNNGNATTAVSNKERVQQQQQQQQPHEEENTCVENDAEYLAMLQQFRDALTL